MRYGVGVLMAVAGVAVLTPAVGDGVALAVPGSGAVCVLFVLGTAVFTWLSGHACNCTGKFVQVLAFVQILRVTDVFSSPLQSTTCLPLFTSMVEQLVLTVVPVVVVVLVDADATTSNVAVSGNTNNACAILSTQNWHSTRKISAPVTGIPGVWLVPAAGEPTTDVVCVLTLWVMLNVAVSRPAVGVSKPVTVSVVAVSAVIVVSAPAAGVLVARAGNVLLTSVGEAV